MPLIALVELVYLIRKPWRFNWLAVLVGLFIGGLSYLFLLKGGSSNLVFITQVVAVFVYYGIRLH